MSNLTSTVSGDASVSSDNNRGEPSSSMYTQQQYFSQQNQSQDHDQQPQQTPAKKKRSLPGNPMCFVLLCVWEFPSQRFKTFYFWGFLFFFNREILGFSGLLFSFLWFEFFSDADAEVIALSSKSLLATNRFVCEICNKGFQRDQNLQLHRRGHGLPWKLKQRAQPYPASFFWQHEIRHQRRKKKLTAWKTERFHNQRKTNNFYSMQLNIPSVSLILPSLCCCQWWCPEIKLNYLALQWKERPNLCKLSKSRCYIIQIFTHKSAHSLSGTRKFQICKI